MADGPISIVDDFSSIVITDVPSDDNDDDTFLTKDATTNTITTTTTTTTTAPSVSNLTIIKSVNGNNNSDDDNDNDNENNNNIDNDFEIEHIPSLLSEETITTTIPTITSRTDQNEIKENNEIILNQTTPSPPQGTPTVPSPTPPHPPPPPPLCKHWAKTKSCLYHSRGKCKFSHPSTTIPTHSNNEPKEPPPHPQRNRTKGGRLQTKNDARVAQFRHFMDQQLKQKQKKKKTKKSTSISSSAAATNTTTSTDNDSNNTNTNGVGTDDAGANTINGTNGTDSTNGTNGTGLQGARVLDVAGGKGELAYQLLHLCDVESCHVVDPRTLSLKRYQSRRKHGYYHKSQFLHPEIVLPQDLQEQPIGHLQCLFTKDLWEMTTIPNNDNNEDNNDCSNTTNDNNNDNENDNNNDPALQKKELEKTFQQTNGRATEAWIWPPPRNGNKCHCRYNSNYDTYNNDNNHHDDENVNDEHEHPEELDDDRDDDTTIQQKSSSSSLSSNNNNNNNNDNNNKTASFPTFDYASTIVQNATVIAGMHPDQAVDAIVDAALYLNVSFFVVPCCTYSAEFPNRKVPSTSTSTDTTTNTTTTDRTVKTYEELLDYLQAKSNDIQRAILPFEGKNICLYRVV